MRHRLRFFAVLLILIFLVGCGATTTTTTTKQYFVGSAKSNKYHYPECEWAQKILPENLVKFNNPEEARNGGYIACKVCSPP